MNSASRSVFLCLLLTLAGCGGTAEALGLGRNPPDEFSVVDRPPLSVPPDFELRPPRPGAPRPQETSTQGRASAVLFGGERTASSASSDSERVLLTAAGANKADPAIRDRIDREAAERVVGSKRLIDDVLWWRDSKPPATTVDPAAEAERLKEAKESGEALNKGATPVIEKEKSGWLGL